MKKKPPALIPFATHRLSPYLRVSDRKQTERAQVARLKRWYDEKGYEWPSDEHIYREKASAFSGDGYSKRHELQRAIADIEAGAIAGIVVLRPNRYFRKTRKALDIYDHLLGLKAALIIVEGDYNALTRENYPRFLQAIATAEDFSLSHGERIMDGKLAKFERGETNASNLARGAKRKHGKVVWTTRALPVREAIKLYVTGRYSVAQVAEMVSTEAERFATHTVYKWLRNPFYYGFVRHVPTKRHDKPYATAKEIADAPLKRGAHKPLVRPGAYKEVMALLAKRAFSGRGAHTTASVYAFGNLYCAVCGQRVTGTKRPDSQGVKHKCYMCQDYIKSRQCVTGRAAAPEVIFERQFEQIIERIALLTDVVDLAKRETEATPATDTSRTVSLLDIRRRREKITADFVNGKISLNELATMKAELDEEEARIMQSPVRSRKRAVEEIVGWLPNFPRLWQAAHPHERRQMTALLFAKIYVNTTDRLIVRLTPHEHTEAMLAAGAFTRLPDGTYAVNFRLDVPTTPNRLLAALEAAGTATAFELAEALGKGIKVIRASLNAFEAAGEVEKVGIKRGSGAKRASILWRKRVKNYA